MIRIRTADFIVSHNTVLGVGNYAFRLKAGEKIEVYDRNKYNQVRVVIQGQEVLINGTMLDRVANKQKIVHYPKEPTKVIGSPVLCGDMAMTGIMTRDSDQVTCEKCLSILKPVDNV